MKLNDFIKQDPTPKKSGYKVVVGNTPKEQELEKQASQAAVLESSLTAANLQVAELQKENEFLKNQVKRTQHEIDDARGKVETQQNLQLELVGKENQITLIQEEIHELAIKDQQKSEKIKQLELDLNTKTGEHDQLTRQNDKLTLEFQSVSANYNGLRAEFDKQKDFSEKLQNDYNKIGERNTALLSEREEISRLKAEYEAKSIRLGEELIRTQEKLRNTEGDLVDVKTANEHKDKKAISSENLHAKLRADLKKIKLTDNDSKSKSSVFNKLYDTVDTFLDNKDQIKTDRQTKERMQSLDWNVSKQELKLGNASTYPNKLGFGSSPFFKLNNEEN